MRRISRLVLLVLGLAGCGSRQLEQDVAEARQPAFDEEGDGESCAAPADYEACFAGVDEPLAAVGLGCGGDPEATIALVEGELQATDPDSWRVASYFGHAHGDRLGGRLWAPREPSDAHNLDDRLLLLSTGRLPPLGDDDGLTVSTSAAAAEGANDNPDSGPLPAPLSAAPGSNGGVGGTPLRGCDGVDDCSDSLAPLLADGVGLHDRVGLRARVEVPAGTRGLALDLALFSAEYPEFVDSPFSDLLVVWVVSEAFTGNLALVHGRALTSTALAEAGWMAHVGDDPALAGTGFEGHGGSGWLTLRAPVVPGETVELAVLLADMGDPEVATLVALDDLRWACEGCELGRDDARGCGLVF